MHPARKDDFSQLRLIICIPYSSLELPCGKDFANQGEEPLDFAEDNAYLAVKTLQTMNKFQRNPLRELPDGRILRVFPFHFSSEGVETKILCRDEEDYDVMVKILAICARRKNVMINTYIVVSNHVHAVILAESQENADEFGEETKKMYAMYYSRKYSDKSAMKGIDSKAIFIDSDWYLRNAICYDIRNAADNGAKSLMEYKWSGARAIFRDNQIPDEAAKYVKNLTKRDRRRIMHTDDDLSGVRWTLDGNERLVPSSICDWRYIEAAFNDDQAFFFKALGSVNLPEMDQKLIDNPRTFQKDGDFLVCANDISQRWFKTDVTNLPVEKKARLVLYVYHCFRTNAQQLARIFQLPVQKVQDIISRK